MDAHGTDSPQEAHSQAVTPLEQDGVKRFHAAVVVFQHYRDTAAASSVRQDATDLVLPVSVTRRSVKLASIYDGTSPCSSWGPKLSKLQGVLLLHDLMDACLPVQHLSEFEAAIMRTGSPVPSQVDVDSGEAFAAGVRDLEPLQASSALLLRMYHLIELEAARVLSAGGMKHEQTAAHTQALCGLLRAALRGDVCGMQWYQSREGMSALLEEAPVRELLRRMQDLSRLVNEQQYQLAASQLLQPEGGMLQGCLLASNDLGALGIAAVAETSSTVFMADLLPQLRMDVTAAQSLLCLTVTCGELDTVLQVLDTKLVAGVQYPPVSYDSLKAALACGCPREMLSVLLRKGLVRGQHTLSAWELGHLVWDTAPSANSEGLDGDMVLRLLNGLHVEIAYPSGLVHRAINAAQCSRMTHGPQKHLAGNAFLLELLQHLLPESLPCAPESCWVHVMCFVLSVGCARSTRDAVLRMLAPVPGFEDLFLEAQSQLLSRMTKITEDSWCETGFSEKGMLVWCSSTVRHPALTGLWDAERLFASLPHFNERIMSWLAQEEAGPVLDEFALQQEEELDWSKSRNLLLFIVQSHACVPADQWREAWTDTIQTMLPRFQDVHTYTYLKPRDTEHRNMFHAQVLLSLDAPPFKDLLLWLWSGQASERAWGSFCNFTKHFLVRSMHLCTEPPLSPDTVAELLDTGVQHLPEATLAKRLFEVDTLLRADMALPCIITHFMRACEDGKAVLASGMLQYIACHCSVETLLYLVSERLHVSLAHVQAQGLQVGTSKMDDYAPPRPSCGCKSFAEICAEAADFARRRPLGCTLQYQIQPLLGPLQVHYEICEGVPIRRVRRLPNPDRPAFERARYHGVYASDVLRRSRPFHRLWKEWRNLYRVKKRHLRLDGFISDWAIMMTAYTPSQESWDSSGVSWGLPVVSRRSFCPPAIPKRTLVEGQDLLQAWLDTIDSLAVFQQAAANDPHYPEKYVKHSLRDALRKLVLAACFRATGTNPEVYTLPPDALEELTEEAAVTEAICQDAALRIFFGANWSLYATMLRNTTQAVHTNLKHLAHPSCASALQQLYEGCATATLELQSGPYDTNWALDDRGHNSLSKRHAIDIKFSHSICKASAADSLSPFRFAAVESQTQGFELAVRVPPQHPFLQVLRHYRGKVQHAQSQAQAQMDGVLALRDTTEGPIGVFLEMLLCRHLAFDNVGHLFEVAYRTVCPWHTSQMDPTTHGVRSWVAIITHLAAEKADGMHTKEHAFRLLSLMHGALAWCIGLHPDWIQLPELHLECDAPTNLCDENSRRTQLDCIGSASRLLQVLCMFVQDVLLPLGHPSASVAAAVVKQWYLHGTSRLPGVHEGIMRWLVNGLVRACRWGGGSARPLYHVYYACPRAGLQQALGQHTASYLHKCPLPEPKDQMMPSSLPVRRAGEELHRGRRVMLLSRTSRRRGPVGGGGEKLG